MEKPQERVGLHDRSWAQMSMVSISSGVGEITVGVADASRIAASAQQLSGSRDVSVLCWFCLLDSHARVFPKGWWHPCHR